MRRGFLLAAVALSCRPAAPQPTIPTSDPIPATAAPQTTKTPKTPEPEPDDALDAVLEQPTPSPVPEGWPADVPWVSHPEFAYPYVEPSAAGDAWVLWWATRIDFEETAAQFIAALGDAGYTFPDPCTLSENASCRLALGNRLTILTTELAPYDDARLRVTLHVYPSDHQPPSQLPGKCVVPPQRRRAFSISSSGINQDGESFNGERREEVETSPGPDLDGDGDPEVYVPHAKKGRCPWEIPVDVFVMRGPCGHRVGTIVGGIEPHTTVAPFDHGLRIIDTRAEWAAFDGDGPQPNHHTRTRRYVFDGKRLRKRSDDDSEGVCHHCGVVHCGPA